MATSTQYNPQVKLNAQLLAAGASKTVYALVTPQIEAIKAKAFGNYGEDARAEYLEQFRDAWTAKQDRFHEDFFDTWCYWSKPVVDFDRTLFPFYYPTAGASEPIRQLIFDFAARGGEYIHVFEGEYEGYKAMAEAAGLTVIEHGRNKDWRVICEAFNRGGFHYGTIRGAMNIPPRPLFFVSQPSAIDGNIWENFNEFVSLMPKNSVVADMTYVGAVSSVTERFDLTAPSIRNIVFSLSKPFGAYYDRIGGVFCREEDLGLFGNKWFKGLTGLRIGTMLMQKYDVFAMPRLYKGLQEECVIEVGEKLGLNLTPSDIYILATSDDIPDTEMGKYLTRAGKLRVCVTKMMAETIGTSGKMK